MVREKAPRSDDEGAADVTEATQDALVDESSHAPAPEEAAKPRSRRGRAKIPSWDEIMFGGPTG